MDARGVRPASRATSPFSVLRRKGGDVPFDETVTVATVLKQERLTIAGKHLDSDFILHRLAFLNNRPLGLSNDTGGNPSLTTTWSH